MGIAELKVATNYQKPTQRGGCANCGHCGHADNGLDGPWVRSWLTCHKHGFSRVQGGAICDAYERRRDGATCPPPL